MGAKKKRKMKKSMGGDRNSSMGKESQVQSIG